MKSKSGEIRRAVATTACGLLLAVLAATELRAAGAEPATAAAAVSEDRYPSRQVSFPGGVTSFADVIYAQYPGFRPQILDVYVPRARHATTRPLVLYVHGGGWIGGSTRNAATFVDFPAVLASLAARGYVVASVEYRLSGEAQSPLQVQDVKAAIKFLRAHAADYGIDKGRVAIWGGSAGGHLAALVGTSCGVPELEPPGANPESDCVQAVVAWYGMFDLAPIADQGAANRMLGCTTRPCEPDKVRIASPVTWLDAGDPPFLLIHGDQDRTVDVSQSKNFQAALQQLKVPAELLVIPGVDHSFVGKTPASTHAAAVQALNRTIAFLDSTVGTKR